VLVVKRKREWIVRVVTVEIDWGRLRNKPVETNQEVRAVRVRRSSPASQAAQHSHGFFLSPPLKNPKF